MTVRGIPFGRYGGVPVTVGPSWLLVVPIVGLALFAGIDPALGDTWERALVAGLGTVLLFASVCFVRPATAKGGPAPTAK